MFNAIGEGHKIMQRSISHDEALRQIYAADPMQAVIDMHTLAGEANELEDRIQELERQRELLARNLAEAPWCLACQIKICSNGGKDIDPLLVDRNECKNVLIRWAEQAAKEAGK